MMAVKASIANTLLGLKKAGSTSCLAPPSPGSCLASRSLPLSPCASRKVESQTTAYDYVLPLPWEEKSAKINRDFFTFLLIIIWSIIIIIFLLFISFCFVSFCLGIRRLLKSLSFVCLKSNSECDNLKNFFMKRVWSI